MEITPKKYQIKHYWTPELSDNNNSKNENHTSQFEQLIKKTIKSQLRSDVRVGCQLSGGIDSSLVTTLARDYFKNVMDTFSIIPEDKNFSEEAYIDEVIAKTQPHAHKIEVNPEYWVNNICSATYHIDAPVSFPHTLGIKKLAETAQGKVKVLLSGEGSDELMGGYREFFKFAHRKRHFNNILLASKMPFKGRKFQKHFLPGMDPEHFFIRLRSSYFKKGLQVKPDIDDTVFFKNLRQLMPNSNDPLKNIRLYDMRVRLPHLLAMQDRMTMASSIENRVPFLDREIIDFVFSRPSNQFISTGFNPFRYKSAEKYTKVLLKKVASLHYNKQFVYRKKMGFNQPLVDYLVFPRMGEMINDLILPGIKKRGLFNYSLLKKSHQKMGEASRPQSCVLLWRFLAFELWAQIFINRKAIY